MSGAFFNHSSSALFFEHQVELPNSARVVDLWTLESSCLHLPRVEITGHTTTQHLRYMLDI